MSMIKLSYICFLFSILFLFLWLGLSSCRRRIDLLEHQGNSMAEQAKRLSADIEELSVSYCNAVRKEGFCLLLVQPYKQHVIFLYLTPPTKKIRQIETNDSSWVELTYIIGFVLCFRRWVDWLQFCLRFHSRYWLSCKRVPHTVSEWLDLINHWPCGSRFLQFHENQIRVVVAVLYVRKSWNSL